MHTYQISRLSLVLAPFFLMLTLFLGACRPDEKTRPLATPAATATPTPLFTPRPSQTPVLSPAPSATPAAAAHPTVIYDPTNGTVSYGGPPRLGKDIDKDGNLLIPF